MCAEKLGRSALSRKYCFCFYYVVFVRKSEVLPKLFTSFPPPAKYALVCILTTGGVSASFSERRAMRLLPPHSPSAHDT